MKFSNLIAIIGTTSAVRVSMMQGPPQGGPPQGGPTPVQIANHIFKSCETSGDDLISWQEASACGAPADFKKDFLAAAGKDKLLSRRELIAALKDDGEAQRQGPSPQQVADHIFKQCDASKDGLLSWKEASACGAPADFKKEFLEAAGTDKLLSRSEFIAAMKDDGMAQLTKKKPEGPPSEDSDDEEEPSPKDMVEEIFKHCDADGNNEITWKEAKKCGAPRAFKKEFMEAAGKDKRVDRKELLTALEDDGEAQRRPSLKRMLNRIFKKCDTSKDGLISWEEAQACDAPVDKAEFEKIAGATPGVSRSELKAYIISQIRK